jgi:hypothetical protein
MDMWVWTYDFLQIFLYAPTNSILTVPEDLINVIIDTFFFTVDLPPVQSSTYFNITSFESKYISIIFVSDYGSLRSKYSCVI